MNLLHLTDEVTIEFLSHQAGSTVSRIDFDPHAAAAVHTHAQEEINYALQGRFEVKNGAETLVIETGQAVHIAPNVAHNITNLGETPGSVLSFWAPGRQDLVDFVQKKNVGSD